MDVRIKKYEVYFYDLPEQPFTVSPRATVFVYDEQDTFRGELVFYPLAPGGPSPGDSSYDPTTRTVRVLMEQSALAGVLDALGGPAPCTLTGVDTPRPELHVAARAQPGFRPNLLGQVVDVVRSPFRRDG